MSLYDVLKDVAALAVGSNDLVLKDKVLELQDEFIKLRDENIDLRNRIIELEITIKEKKIQNFILIITIAPQIIEFFVSIVGKMNIN